TVPADDIIPADAVPASTFISAKPTIPADRVIAAEASVLAVDGCEGKPIYNRFTKVNHYKGVPPPMNGNYMPTSTSPDTAESPRPYGKQTSESTKIKSTSKNSNFSFDFSDRSSVPTASDSCVESARPNNVVNDSEDFTSRTSTSGSEEQVDNVCSPQEALSSSTSLVIDVQSSDSMCNKFGYLHLFKDCNFHKHNGKGILGKGPSENHVNTSYQRSFPIPADKSFGSRAYTPYYPKSKHFPTSHNSYYSMQLANGTFGGTAIKPSAGWPWTKQNSFYSQGSKINDGSKSKSWLHTYGLQGRSKSFMAWVSKIADSGCSRSMSGNKDTLDDFVDFDGGPVRFGGSNGMITGKGTIKTKHLDFENVLYVPELEPFNLISISKNLYTFSLEELAPQAPITCLLAKASQDESNLWHRRFRHVNFRNMNKLVKGNLVRDSLLPTIFWTEVVATACYVLNRVLVAKPHNKTPYELLTDDKPAIGYLKPFGCQVTILNTSDYLGKFDEKGDEGYIVGYSIPGKAYR
nr:ribonuclease H-like domain-containing protein [Tanacetum cinerariifolium]